jgi:hypothetical protein
MRPEGDETAAFFAGKCIERKECLVLAEWFCVSYGNCRDTAPPLCEEMTMTMQKLLRIRIIIWILIYICYLSIAD